MKATRRAVLAVLLVCIPLVGTPASDRGIGGTGAPLSGGPSAAAPSGPRVSDRGIGGTGIVGVITGFGSILVNGLEVAYSPTTPITVDGIPETDAAPRVGQLATIVASEDNGLRAVSIDLRHEVSGIVTSVTPGGPDGVSPRGMSPGGVNPGGVNPGGVNPGGVNPGGMNPGGVSPGGVSPGGVTPGGMSTGEATPGGANPGGASPNSETLVVAGQTVAIDGATEGTRTVHPGDWVAVSGLREPDGVIAASRIDPRRPGTVLVRGTVMQGPGGWRIGELSVQPPNGATVAAGTNISVRGTMVNGGLSDTTVDPDVLSSDPAAFFGAHVRRMVIESYVSAAGGHLRVGTWMARRARPRNHPSGWRASGDRPTRTRGPWRLCRDPPAPL